MLTEQSDFRLYLQEELVRRIKSNSGYSMRAFAKNLDVDASRLSKMLRGDRPIKSELIEKFGQKMNLAPSKIEGFKTFYFNQKHGISKSITKTQSQYMQISQDTFEVIVDWQHYAILELMKLESFEPSSKWISKKLSITINEVNVVIERLKRVGLLKIESGNVWVDTSNGFSTHVLGNNYTSYAHRKSQEQILELAKRALNDVSIERRDQSSMLMATSAARLSEAKEMIRTFRRQLCAFLEGAEVKDSLYQLSVSLFPVTEIAGEEKDNNNLPA